MATGRKFRKTRETFLATINSHNIFLPTFFSMKLYFLRVKPFSTYAPYDLFPAPHPPSLQTLSVPHPPSLQTCVQILINPSLEHVILSIYYPRRFGFARLSQFPHIVLPQNFIRTSLFQFQTFATQTSHTSVTVPGSYESFSLMVASKCQLF